MQRLFSLLSLLFLNAFACEGGYNSCIAKVKDSYTIQNNSLFIPVKNHRLLIYSQKKPKYKISKYDPFLSLYLVEDRKKFLYPFDINMRLQLGSAIVNKNCAKEGRFRRNQIGLNSLARYSEKLNTLALITTSCCSLEGIVTPSGVIQKEYIQRFLSHKSADYSDIGIRVQNSKGSVKIVASNPFLKSNSFKKGDVILELDRQRIKSASLFMRKILFSPVGSFHKVKIQRGKKVLIFRVKTFKRVGGGSISDTFLEQKGIYFDDALSITKLNSFYKKYGLRVGDKLLKVNGKYVKNQEQLLKNMEKFKDFSSLLFEREKFQFFVNIK